MIKPPNTVDLKPVDESDFPVQTTNIPPQTPERPIPTDVNSNLKTPDIRLSMGPLPAWAKKEVTKTLHVYLERGHTTSKTHILKFIFDFLVFCRQQKTVVLTITLVLTFQEESGLRELTQGGYL